MITPILDDFADFFTRYRAFHTTTESQTLQTFQSRFEPFKAAYQIVKAESLAEAKQFAPYFNIFRVLGLAHYEVRTHSAFLAHLLDPEQNHGQQTLFLGAFLRHCQSKFDSFPLQQNTEEIARSRWLINRELNTDFGNLDIVLRCPDYDFICVLENKIYASEQTDQLRRYADWLQTQKDEYAHRWLFYLTRQGDPSQTALGTHYEALSYRVDVTAILTDVLDQISAPKVKETVRQYMQLIAQL